jgi:hypothetical protein
MAKVLQSIKNHIHDNIEHNTFPSPIFTISPKYLSMHYLSYTMLKTQIRY